MTGSFTLDEVLDEDFDEPVKGSRISFRGTPLLTGEQEEEMCRTLANGVNYEGMAGTNFGGGVNYGSTGVKGGGQGAGS